MNNIKTETDVIDWAKTIADGKGEKFTPLSKGDMFSIAKYILGISDPCNQSETKETAPEVQESNGEVSPQGTNGNGGAAETKPSQDGEDLSMNPVDSETRTMDMSRGCALHLKGIDAQKAYDQFLEAMAQHPKEKTVMDFSTGQSSTFAAFAYWLNQPVTVKIRGNAATKGDVDGKAV